MAAAAELPHAVCVELARAAIAEGPAAYAPEAAAARAVAFRRTLLTPVVNATGVLLHTNLGRAPMPFEHPPQAIPPPPAASAHHADLLSAAPADLAAAIDRVFY